MKKLILVLALIIVSVSVFAVPTFSLFTNTVEMDSGTLTGVGAKENNPFNAIRILIAMLNTGSDVYAAVDAEVDSGEYIMSTGDALTRNAVEYFATKADNKSHELDSTGVNYGMNYTTMLIKLGY